MLLVGDRGNTVTVPRREEMAVEMFYSLGSHTKKILGNLVRLLVCGFFV